MDFPIKNGDFPLQNVSTPEGTSHMVVSLSFPMFSHGTRSRMAAQLLLNQLRDIWILLQRRVRHLCSERHGATEAVTVLDGPVIDQVRGQCWRVGELEQGSFFAKS